MKKILTGNELKKMAHLSIGRPHQKIKNLRILRPDHPGSGYFRILNKNTARHFPEKCPWSRICSLSPQTHANHPPPVPGERNRDRRRLGTSPLSLSFRRGPATIHAYVISDCTDLLDELASNLQEAGRARARLPEKTRRRPWMATENGPTQNAAPRSDLPGSGILLLSVQVLRDGRAHGMEQGTAPCLLKAVDLHLEEMAPVFWPTPQKTVARGDFPANDNPAPSWMLNVARMEVIPPNGAPIQLSYNEVCVLKAAAMSQGNLVKRKTLIEALGHKIWEYDERRLEAIISRLRRKLSACVPGRFPVRSVRGQGYLFGVSLKEIPAETC